VGRNRFNDVVALLRISYRFTAAMTRAIKPPYLNLRNTGQRSLMRACHWKQLRRQFMMFF
jgi:hypothetical protein